LDEGEINGGGSQKVAGREVGRPKEKSWETLIKDLICRRINKPKGPWKMNGASRRPEIIMRFRDETISRWASGIVSHI
jgi:hypothetical protein